MKTFGILLIAITPIIFTYRLGEDLRLKETRRAAFLALLSHIYFEIENFLRDQKEIFDRFENPILKKTRFFQILRERLASAPCGAFGTAWESCYSDFSFDMQCQEVLDHLAKHFGLLEKSAQLLELKRAIDLLEKKQSVSRAEMENKVKILRISGLTAGLGIFILLI